MGGCRPVIIVSALLVWGTGLVARTSLAEILARLPVLDGPVPTYYIPGTREKAQQVQRLVESARDYYSGRIGVTLAVEVGLVGPDEWRLVNARPQPYTDFMPSVLPGSTYIISIPSGRGHALDTLIQRIVLESGGLTELGLTADELADRFTRLSGLHEIGHFYARKAFEHPAGYPPPWLGEFVASYLVYAFVSDQRAEDARIWRILCAASVEHLRPTSQVSGDFHVGPMADNYLVYLGRLQQRVNDVHRQHGGGFLERLRSVWQEGDSADGPGRAMRLLDQASPGFERWVSQYHR